MKMLIPKEFNLGDLLKTLQKMDLKELDENIFR